MQKKDSGLNRRDFMKKGAQATAVVTSAFLGTDAVGTGAPEDKRTLSTGMLPTRVLGETKVELPVLGYGGAALMQGAGNPLSYQERVELVQFACDRGIRYFDTAGNYGDSQKIIGEGISGRRDEVFLTSKVEVTRADRTRQAFDRVLREMQTDYLDAVLIHGTPGLEQMSVEEAMKVQAELAKLRDEKCVRFIGFSAHSYFDKALALIDSGGFDLCMLSYGYIPRGHNQIWSARMTALRDACIGRAHTQGMGIVAMKVVGAGVLGAWSGYVVPEFDRKRLAKLPAAAIRHVLQDDRIDLLTIGMRVPSEIEANINTLVEATDYTAGDRALLADYCAIALNRQPLKKMRVD